MDTCPLIRHRFDIEIPHRKLVDISLIMKGEHCVKSACIWSYSGPHFPVFRLNMESISPYSIRIRENANQNNSEYGHFLRIGIHVKILTLMQRG